MVCLERASPWNTLCERTMFQQTVRIHPTTSTTWAHRITRILAQSSASRRPIVRGRTAFQQDFSAREIPPMMFPNRIGSTRQQQFDGPWNVGECLGDCPGASGRQFVCGMVAPSYPHTGDASRLSHLDIEDRIANHHDAGRIDAGIRHRPLDHMRVRLAGTIIGGLDRHESRQQGVALQHRLQAASGLASRDASRKPSASSLSRASIVPGNRGSTISSVCRRWMKADR